MIKKRTLCLLLCLLASLCFLAACREEKPEPEPEPVPALTLFADGRTDYAIVRGDRASDTVIEAAVALYTAVNEDCGVPMSLYDEFAYSMAEEPHRIVVGLLEEDPLTAELQGSLLYDDFVFRVAEGDLYIIGGSDQATADAVDYFLEEYLMGTTSLELPGDLDRTVLYEYPLPGLSIDGTPLKDYRIVYDADLYWSRELAVRVQTLFRSKTGHLLELTDDTATETDREILVGVTSRAASQAAAQAFAAPNVYYRLAVEDRKLLLTNQGYQSGDAAYLALETAVEGLSAEACDLNASVLDIDGDIRSLVDRRMQARTEGTDLRLLHNNVLFVAKADNGFTAQMRAELLADTYLCYLPDILTFNEMLTGEPMDLYLRTLLADHYSFVPLSNADSPNADLQKGRCGTPIAYRTDAGLTLLDSSVIEISEGDAFHSAAWAIFRTEDGNLFLILSAHLVENKEDGKWTDRYARKIVNELNRVRRTWGALPMLLNGDWFFWEGEGVKPYAYMIEQGLADAGEVAVNAYSNGMGTFHTVGSGQVNTEEDLTFLTPEWFTVLSHKLLLDYNTINGTDHVPVLVDVQFRGPATEDDIPVFTDPSEPPLPDNHLEVSPDGEMTVDFGAFGAGTGAD